MSTALDEAIHVSYIALDETLADPEFNSRGHITPLDVDELTRSIKEKGLLQPVSVYPLNDEERIKYDGKRYRLILGYRRYTAYKVLGRDTIPAVVKRWMTENDARVLNFQENLKRKDLDVLQQAKALEKFHNAGWTREMIAKRLDVSISWVQIRVNVLSFPEDIQQECAKGTINQDQIKIIYSLPRERQYAEIQRIKKAKERGEKNIQIKKPIRENTTKHRQAGSIGKLRDFIYDNLGPSFATRCLAWAKGDIGTIDLMTDIRQMKEEKGESFTIPEDDF